MKIKAGDKVVQTIIEVLPNGELDEAMLPEGTRLRLKIENPWELPSNHQKRIAIEQDNKSLFIAKSDNFSMPMVNGIGRWENGVYVSKDNLHVIQFSEGEFLADNEIKYQSSYGLMTEAEFLREHLKRLNLRKGQIGPYIEGTREWFKENFGMVEEPKSASQEIDDLIDMEPNEIRGYFTNEEIKEFKLEKASKDKLIVAFIQNNKTLNSTPIKEEMNNE